MRWPWQKKPIEQKPAKQKRPRSSLFSTDVNELGQSIDWDAIIKQSFQILPDQFKPMDAAGKAVEPSKIRYNVAAPGIGQFAMDAGEGNVLAMKPNLGQINQIPEAQALWYAGQGFIGYQLCAMIGQQWLVLKAITLPARDAMSNGYEITTDDDVDIDPKVIKALKKIDKKMNINKQLVQFVTFNRTFGIRIALPVIDNNDLNYYQVPFDIKKVKPGSYRGIAQIDPYWVTPELDFDSTANPASVHFYEPTWWRVNGVRIHRSHLVIITNGEVADILKPTYYFGGISVAQKLAERVYAAERTANEAPQLAITKRTTVFKVDIAQALAQMQAFLQKVNFFSTMRDNYGTKVIGLDDEMEQHDISLSDFPDTIMSQYQLVAAAADVPAAKLLEDSPKGGLGSNGDFESDSYDKTLKTIQTNDMQPLLERHHMLAIASDVRPALGETLVPADWEPVILWNPVDTPDAKTQAEINEIKSRVGNNLSNSGAIDGIDERARVAMDKDSGYTGLGDREPEIADEEPGDVESDQTQSGETK